MNYLLIPIALMTFNKKCKEIFMVSLKKIKHKEDEELFGISNLM